MEDRYLFKAKRIDNGEWVQGYIVKYGYTGREKYYIVPDYASALYSFLIDSSTICQCTGLKDKNGKLIWENDIVNCIDAECCGYISWNESEAGFYFNVLLEGGRFDEEHIYDYQDCMEVIGNIFDNAELLESEG
nr:MAG TPA: YopX protein [Bacteriophage sp.]